MAKSITYNYRELAVAAGLDLASFRSDIDLFLHRGPETLLEWIAQLNGDFAGILYNNATGQLLAFRDRMGVKPLFVGWDASGEQVAWSSLLSAIHEIPSVVRAEEFPPGTVYDSDIDFGIRFTDPVHAAKLTSPTVTRACIVELLTAAVRRRILHSDVPVAFLCSGGLDSSILLTLGYQIWTQELGQTAASLHVFSLEYESEGGGGSRDAFFARQLCAELGVTLTTFSFTQADIDAHIDVLSAIVETDDHRSFRAAVPQYMLAKRIAETTPYKVLLSGEGADELFLGYNYCHMCPSAQEAESESNRLLENLYRYDLLRADRCMSAFGLELRVPFLDPTIVEFVSHVSGDLRRPGPSEKQLLRDAFSGVQALVKTRILEREKEKFSDGCGLKYVPALMRTLAHRMDPSLNFSTHSAHTLERYEREWCATRMRELFDTLVIPSNAAFRELPSWTQTQTQTPVQTLERVQPGPKHAMPGVEEAD